MKINIEKAKKELVDYLSQNLSIKIVDKTVIGSQIILTIDSINNLKIEIDEYGITILYADEHDQFLLAPYKNEEIFFNDVVKRITLLLRNPILIEYVYSGEILLGYKIWAIEKESGERRLLKKVTTSINPFLQLRSKSTTAKEVMFRNQ